jgi:hypothetical protein
MNMGSSQKSGYLSQLSDLLKSKNKKKKGPGSAGATVTGEEQPSRMGAGQRLNPSDRWDYMPKKI